MKVNIHLSGWVAGFVMAVLVAATVRAEKVSLQDFETGNGTKDHLYFSDVWQSAPDFETDKVHSGRQALRLSAPDKGGTVSVYFSNNRQSIDLTNVKSFSIWVYDTQGDNTVQIRLKDVNGNGGAGTDDMFLWSANAAQKDKWTKVKWMLSDYPAVEGLDLKQIRCIELYELQAGTYYFDDLEAN